MSMPKQRLAIAPAECQLILPVLEVVVSGMALGSHGDFPHRNPWHNVDRAASNVYRHRVFDAAMATRIQVLYAKLRGLSHSRKFRFDPFDLTAIGFAPRQWKAHRPSGATEAMSTAVKALQAKIERCRRRARRAMIAKEGRAAYQEGAVQWFRFSDWLHYTLLYFHVPSNLQPFRARFWKEQRQQLARAITASLQQHFREVSSNTEMTRVVTLLSRSLRRDRHLRYLKGGLKNPHANANFLFEFVEKRLILKTLPGAPVPAWQACSDRAEKFIAFARDRQPSAVARFPTGGTPAVAAAERELAIQNPVDASDELSAERTIIITTESIVSEVGAWFNNDVTPGFERPAFEQAQFLIGHNLHEPCRRQTTATTVKGLIEELRPAEHPQLAEEPINEYVAWVLGCLLAVRSDRASIYDGVSFGIGRALAIREGRQNVR